MFNIRKGKVKWEKWVKKYNSLLKSNVFKDYENAEVLFFNSKEWQEYRDAERNILISGVFMYLGDDYHRQHDLHGTTKYVRWVSKKLMGVDNERE